MNVGRRELHLPPLTYSLWRIFCWRDRRHAALTRKGSARDEMSQSRPGWETSRHAPLLDYHTSKCTSDTVRIPPNAPNHPPGIHCEKGFVLYFSSGSSRRWLKSVRKAIYAHGLAHRLPMLRPLTSDGAASVTGRKAGSVQGAGMQGIQPRTRRVLLLQLPQGRVHGQIVSVALGGARP
jgi:hypothetical protein